MPYTTYENVPTGLGLQVDMRHRKTGEDQLAVIDDGMDLNSYYSSVEWDLMTVWAKKTENKYPCCPEPYPDVTFHFIVSYIQ